MGNRFRYILFFVFCMFLFPLFTRAECSYERVSDLSKMASNVQVSYTYEFLDEIKYTVHITNLTNDLYVLDSSGSHIYGNNDVSIDFTFGEFSEYQLGDTIRYEVYSNDVNCKDEYLSAKYITLPNYNRFALSDTCKNYPNFKYCSLWKYTNLDYETFNSSFQSYLQNLENKSVVNNSDYSFDFVAFLKTNYVFIICIFIFLSVILLIFLKKVVSRWKNSLK